ncbi:MAG: phosphoribosylformylglycinamidine synthase subunit PurQ [Geminicoccaceae bacterium]
MRTAVVTFPGSNCDRDLAVAFETVFGSPVLRVWHQETELPELDLIGVPGGFSYGDYLRCGAMAARSPVMREVVRRAEAGVAVLGVCNGFQILAEAGLLPGALIRNAGLGFVCRFVELEAVTRKSPFTTAYGTTPIRLPVAHHDGNYVIDRDGLARLEDEDRIAFRYRDNPNGSTADIAGVLGSRRNVLGLMPHPERAIEPLLGGTDGLPMFRSLLESLA